MKSPKFKYEIGSIIYCVDKFFNDIRILKNVIVERKQTLINGNLIENSYLLKDTNEFINEEHCFGYMGAVFAEILRLNDLEDNEE